MGKYIYGVINSNTKKSFSPFKVAAKELGRRFVSNKVEESPGEGGEVYTISYQDISAVVSELEIVDYTHMPKDAVARLLLRHQMVIEGIMPDHTIIPMRLGTFVSEENEVRDILNKGYRLIKDIFKKISDKIEIDVVAVWSDFNSVIKEIGEEIEIKEIKERLFANPEGVTVDDAMKAGVMVKKAMDEKRKKYSFQIQDALKTVCQDFKVHELMDDKMIANSAFLIEKAKSEDFDRKIEDLNSSFGEKLNFKCVGPLPPYSFYTLEIKKLQFKEIGWARKMLGLNNTATEKEIKRAHRAKASFFHPDKNTDTPGIEREFDDTTRAYKILVDYCRAYERGGQEGKFSFKEEEIKKNMILVKVRD